MFEVIFQILTPAQIGGWVRTGLAAAGGSVIATGWIDGDTWTAVAGATALVVTGLWSHFQKKFAEQKLVAAKAAPAV
jgi:uncharacterized membrane protein YjjB (DUF3815 family)